MRETTHNPYIHTTAAGQRHYVHGKTVMHPAGAGRLYRSLYRSPTSTPRDSHRPARSVLGEDLSVRCTGVGRRAKGLDWRG
jgi:hypothetical protein